jgi:hypothetical protein
MRLGLLIPALFLSGPLRVDDVSTAAHAATTAAYPGNVFDAQMMRADSRSNRRISIQAGKAVEVKF